SVAEARSALARALGRGAHAEAILVANLLVAAGGTLEAAEEAGVIAAIDALGARELAVVHGQLAPRLAPAPLLAFRLALFHAHTGDDAAALTWLERSAG